MAADMVTQVLSHWSTPGALRAVAYLLHETLTRFDAATDMFDCAFVEHRPLPLAILPEGSVRPTDAPPATCVSVIDLLWLCYANGPSMGAAGPPYVAAVRALFLLLFMFDGRVQELVLVRNHGGHDVLHTRPPKHERAVDFLQRSGAFAQRCYRLIEELVHAPAPAAILADFVDWARRVWLWGMDLDEPAEPPAEPMEKEEEERTTS
jgi:hypothetical protein